MPCASLLRGLPALAGAAVFAAGLAAAQDADLDARIEEAQQRYEEAWTTGDIDALVELHAEDAVMWPFDGGMHEGRDAIRGYFEDNPRPESFDVRSGRTERIGEFILNVGTFTGAMPADAGGAPMQGEYVVIARESDGALQLHRVIAFPPRREPGGAQ